MTQCHILEREKTASAYELTLAEIPFGVKKTEPVCHLPDIKVKVRLEDGR